MTVNTTGTEFQVTNNGVVMGNVLTDNHSITGSLKVTGSNHSIFGNVLIGSTNAAGTERFGVTRDDGVTDGLHIIADFNRSGASSAELILGYYASGSAVTGPVVYASNSQPLLFAAGAQERLRITSGGIVGIGTGNVLSWYNSGYTALQIGGMAGVFSNTSNTSITGGLTMAYNIYVDSAGNYQYMNTTNARAGSTMVMEGGNIYFSNAAAGTGANPTVTERMRITSGGKIGIGAISPNWLLEICCNTTATGGGGYPAISINNPNDAGYSALYFFKGTTNMGGLELSNATCHLFINSICTFAIQTNGVERLRVTNCGGVVIGSCLAAPTGAENGWWVKTPNETRAYFSSTTEALAINRYGSTGIMLAFDYAGSGKGNISTNGSAISYNTTSDYRLKEDLKEVSGLDKVSAIKVYDFKWKNSDNRMDGVLAHELQQILPYAVIGEKDAEQMQGVDYSKLAPVMVKAIQEQQCTICSQATIINQLKNCLGIN